LEVVAGSAVAALEAAGRDDKMAKKYGKLNFSIGFKTYKGERLMLICILAFSAFVGLPFLLLAFFVPFFGLIPLVFVGFFWFIVSKGLQDIKQNWPVCKNHGLRMDVAAQKPDKNGMMLVTFTCPKKDKRIKLLALASRGGGHGHHGGIHGGGFHGGGGHFGGGHSGGGGAGR